MAALIWLPLLLPSLLAALGFGLRRRRWTMWLPIAAAAVVLLAGIALLVAVQGSGAVVAGAGLLRADPLSAWLLSVVGAVAVISLWGGLPEPGTEERAGGVHAALLCLFLAAMTLAVTADNLGLMWVAIELTTITTAFLVASGGGRNALEAAWKYVVLGAVGVAIAFLGIVLLSAASQSGGEATLSWTLLLQRAPVLDPALLRVAGALTVLGFATKAGLAPMHAWLPDAHSQAPAPVSGLMSGVLLSVACYAILRVQAVVDAAVGPELMRTLLLTAGLLSLTVAAGLVLTQRDYKRLLAYSSIEHMGLLALGAAAGGQLAIAALLLHMLGHGLVKATMFVLAGRISSLTGSHRIADVHGLLQRRPDLGGPFLLGAAALLGLPPFVTFFTEVAIVVAGFQRGLTLPFLAACGLLLLGFAGIARQVLAMTVGAGRVRGAAGGSAASPSTAPGSGWPRRAPVVVALGLTAVLGFAAWPLAGTLLAAVAALGGVR